MHREFAAERVVAIAASAGGLAAVRAILGGLPADFPHPVLVLVHLWPKGPSHLAEVLRLRTPLRVVQGSDGERLEAGSVYVACPDHHLTVDAQHCIRLTRGERVRFARPSADVLFQSVADAYGSQGVGVVCSGSGQDGADGLLALRLAGGLTIAQDEATSEHFGMPGSAISAGAAARVLALPEIAPALIAWARCADRPVIGE